MLRNYTANGQNGKKTHLTFTLNHWPNRADQLPEKKKHSFSVRRKIYANSHFEIKIWLGYFSSDLEHHFNYFRLQRRFLNEFVLLVMLNSEYRQYGKKKKTNISKNYTI